MSAITATRVYSEVRTAELLGLKRSTLAVWRTSGKLRPDLVLVGVRPAGRTTPVTYDAELVDSIAEGEQSPFPEN